MAIIYTYPEKSNIDGSELLLISDGTDENNTKVISTAEYGSYIQATYGGGGGSSIYQANGSIIGDRTLSGLYDGSNYSLTFTSLSGFTVGTIAGGNINLNPGSGGDITVGDGADIVVRDAYGIKNISNPTTSRIYWNTDLLVDSANSMRFTCNNVNGFTQFTNGTNGLMSVINGLVVLSGSNNDISNITAGTNKTLTTKEWVSDYVANFIGSTNITTLGTITTGTWNGTAITESYGGTGQSSYSTGDILYADGANSLSKLGIGNAGEVLTVSGGLPSWQSISSSSLTNVTTTYTVLSTDETVNCTSVSGFTVNLTTAVGEIGRKIIIKNSGTGDILVDADAAETIDGALTATLVQYESITVQSDGANWIII
jgi:hypothetical protein